MTGRSLPTTDPPSAFTEAPSTRKPNKTTHTPKSKSSRHNNWNPSPRSSRSNAHSESPSQPKSSTSLDPGRHPYFHATKQRYLRMSRRKKVAIGAIIACLLILIIGLAAGLSSQNNTQNLPLPSKNGGPYQGDLTYYAPGLGACGIDSRNGDNIVAVSHLLYDAVSTGSDPNQNPLCGKMVRARTSTQSVDLKVVDRCTGCEPRDLDTTEKTFAKLANVDRGRVTVEWSWLEDVPGGAS